VFPSELGRNNCGSQLFYSLCSCCMMSVDQGSSTSLYTALTPGLEQHSGKYFQDCALTAPPNPLAHNDELAKALWEMRYARRV
jgi:hypothetical protein